MTSCTDLGESFCLESPGVQINFALAMVSCILVITLCSYFYSLDSVTEIQVFYRRFQETNETQTPAFAPTLDRGMVHYLCELSAQFLILHRLLMLSDSRSDAC